MTTGVCRNPGCMRAARAEPIERYPGPGEFCPECGERLESVEARLTEAFFPPPERPRSRKVPLALVVVLAAVAVAVGVGAMAAARRGPSSAQAAMHVCPSSMTHKFASDLVSAYVANAAPAHTQVQVSDATPCHVRFSASATERGSAVVARDAIVAIVNPQNVVTRLSEAQIRGIMAGTITDWSEVGGTAGNIVPILPDAGTDEARILGATLLRGAEIAPTVRKLASTAEIVRAVTSASADGRSSIALVAFSAAPPAKVLGLGSAPYPNPLTIEERRYPLAVTVTVQ
ncbi:MAG TPA: substrate-binding domain-containing protein, partial [Candidatus Acidoferrum sp.]|nr:substrate-binding domain-containing protein [Candidatus Acidoferrum sp.]